MIGGAEPGSTAGPERTFTAASPLRADGSLTVHNFKGSIVLSSWEREEVEVRARIVGRGELGEAYAQASAEAVQIELGGAPLAAVLRSDYSRVPITPSGRQSLPFVHYEIRAPRRIDIQVRDHGSEIRISRFSGKVDVETHKGRLAIDEITGEFRLRAHEGNLRLSRLEGSFVLASRRGDLDVEALTLAGESSVSTHRGTLLLRLPPEQPLSLLGDLDRRARFSSDLAGEPLYQEGGRLRGAINGGGEGDPRLRLDSHRGEIRLRRSGEPGGAPRE